MSACTARGGYLMSHQSYAKQRQVSVLFAGIFLWANNRFARLKSANQCFAGRNLLQRDWPPGDVLDWPVQGGQHLLLAGWRLRRHGRHQRRQPLRCVVITNPGRMGLLFARAKTRAIVQRFVRMQHVRGLTTQSCCFAGHFGWDFLKVGRELQ